MKNNKWMLLQLFAEGGEGAAGEGAASATVETSVDDGHQRLRELGVPEDKIRKNRAYKSAAPVQTAPKEQPAEEQVAAAEEVPAEGQEVKRMTWDEIKNDPEYNAEIQKIIKSRIREEGKAQQRLDSLNPALEILGKKYGVEATDIEGIVKAIEKDDSYLEEEAAANGMSATQYREVLSIKREKENLQRQNDQMLRIQFEQQHNDNLLKQAEEMKNIFPNFDLEKEMLNPTFARMVSPGGGVDVRSAYYAMHHDELQAAAMQVTAQKTAQQMSNAIQSGSMRPTENGTSSRAPSVSVFDYKSASREQRDALKRRILEAGARGEKLYPGQ